MLSFICIPYQDMLQTTRTIAVSFSAGCTPSDTARTREQKNHLAGRVLVRPHPGATRTRTTSAWCRCCRPAVRPPWPARPIQGRLVVAPSRVEQELRRHRPRVVRACRQGARLPGGALNHGTPLTYRTLPPPRYASELSDHPPRLRVAVLMTASPGNRGTPATPRRRG